MIVPIVMEPCMQNPKTWGGKFQAGVGHLLYKDFSSDDDAVWPVAVAGLVKQLRDVLGISCNVQADRDRSIDHVTVAIDQVVRELEECAARRRSWLHRINDLVNKPIGGSGTGC